MPSLRQKVTTYFRQLSFIAEPRDVHGQRGSKAKDEENGNFIIKYLEGRMERIFVPAPEVQSGQNPTDLPDLKLATYMPNANNNTIIAACTGPDEGLTGIKRSKLHLSASFADDIDFIDTITDADCLEVRSSAIATTNVRNQNNKLNRLHKQLTQTNDQNANKTNNALIRSRRNSKTSLTNLNQTSTTTATTTTTTATTTQANTKKYQSYTNTKDAFMRKTQTPLKTEENANSTTTTKTTASTTENKPATIVVSMVSTKPTVVPLDNDQNNKNLINTTTTATKTETSSTGIKRQTKDSNEIGNENENENKENSLHINESNQTNASISGLQLMETSIAGVSNWKMAADYAYGISVSLYETNQLTKESTGNPTADCYGLVVRENAALMALADGVNWGKLCQPNVI